MEVQASNSKELSDDFKQHMHELTVQWKSLLRRNKKVLLKCPNYEKCQYKCSSIGGMQYHYPRCAGANPVFKCHLCGREYESRTGLNYHNASHHTGVGVVLNPSDNGKRSQRKDRKPETVNETIPLPNPLPIVSTHSSTPTIATVPHVSRSLSSPIPSQTTHPVIPSLLKHSGNNSNMVVNKKESVRTKKATVRTKSTKTAVTDVVSLEGVVKSPGGSNKKITISIPSIEYPDEYRSYLPNWRDQLKVSQTVQCPNYDNCQFQCTTVNGMKYHFIRCQKDKLPEFSCSLCDRSFHCRSGLVWHLKNTHKLADLPTNQKTVQVSISNKNQATVTSKEEVKRGRKRKPHPPPTSQTPSAVPTRLSSQITPRKNTRKNEYPRPTAKFYLKYLETQEKPVSYIKPIPTAWIGGPPPVPKLHPPTALSPIQRYEYIINDIITTDNERCHTLTVEYPEELLTKWHQWYSSESDNSYDDNDDIDNEETGLKKESSAHNFNQPRDSFSSGTEESSDEDYMESSYPKGRGKGRGRGRGRKRGVDSTRSFVPSIPSLLSMGSNQTGNTVKQVKQETTKPVTYKQIEIPFSENNNNNITTAIKPVVMNNEIQTMNRAQPIKPPQLVTMVTSNRLQQPSSSSINPIYTLAPGNYYQVSSANLVPLQLVSPVKNTTYQVQPGSLVLVQQPSSHSQFATLQTNVSTPQKVSVIMNPRTVTLATVHAPTTQVISQFDGPKGKRKAITNQKKLDEEFERVKKKAKLSMDDSGIGGCVKGKKESKRKKVTPLNKDGVASDNVIEQKQVEEKVEGCENMAEELVVIGSVNGDSGESSVVNGMKLGKRVTQETPEGDKEDVMDTIRQSTSKKQKNDKEELVEIREEEPLKTKGKKKTSLNKKGANKTSIGNKQGTKKQKEDGAAILDQEETREEPMDVEEKGKEEGPVGKKGKISGKGATTGRKKKITKEVTIVKETTINATSNNNTANNNSNTASNIATSTNAVSSTPVSSTPVSSTPVKNSKKKEKESFVCPTCQEVLSNKRALKTHTETNHFPVSPNATVAERSPHWRESIKKHKYAVCDKCQQYRGKSVTAMKYHYDRCNTTQRLSFVCDDCGKSYTSQPGLAYHMKYFHAEPLLTKEPTPPSIDPNSSSPFSRKAAKTASKKMHEMSKPTNDENGSDMGDNPSDMGDNPSDMGNTEDETLSKANTKILKSIIQRDGSIVCPKGCGQKYTTFLGLQYHLETRHMFVKRFSCPKCKAILSNKKRIISHMTKKHPEYEVDDFDDLEYAPPTRDESNNDSDDDESIDGTTDKKKGKRKGIKERRPTSFRMFDNTNYTEVVEMLRKKLHSNESLFNSYRPQNNDYVKINNNEELYEYLPENTISMKYDDNDVIEEGVELFKTGSNGNIFFTGGPVWCMDWLPSQVVSECGSCTQYVALTAYRTLLQEHSIEDVIKCKGFIQLWSLTDLNNETESVNIHFDLGICHEWGIIRNMKWCPSGTTDQHSTKTVQDYLPRLGLLALACSDGNVRILSIPHPSTNSTPSTDHTPSTDSTPSIDHTPSTDSTPSACMIKVIKVPVLLKPNRTNMADLHFGQCLTIDWLPDKGHHKIAGGYCNGSIVIWDVTPSSTTFTDSPITSSHSQHHLIFPSIFLTNHNGPCRSLSWLPTDSNFLFSVGIDKTTCYWDIRQPYSPLQKLEKSIMLLKTLTPFVWTSLFILEESLTSKPTGSLCMPFLLSSPPHSMSLPTSPDPIASIGYNVWSDCITCGSFGGDVSSMYLTHGIHCTPNHAKNLHSKKRSVISCRMEKLTTPTNIKDDLPSYHSYTVEEVVDNFKVVFRNQQKYANEEVYKNDCMPLSAVTSLSWSPHSNSHRWIMVALNCGLVKVVRTKS